MRQQINEVPQLAEPAGAIPAHFEERPEIGFTWQRGDFVYVVSDVPEVPGSCTVVAEAFYIRP